MIEGPREFDILAECEARTPGSMHHWLPARSNESISHQDLICVWCRSTGRFTWKEIDDFVYREELRREASRRRRKPGGAAA
jgi:hypothetical protein